MNIKNPVTMLFVLRTNTLVLMILVMMSFNVGFAQVHEQDDRTHEKEIIYSGLGKITLETGEEFTGQVTHSRLFQRRVSIKKDDGSAEMYKIGEVKSFAIEGVFFERITTPRVALADPDFAILLSNPTSTIRVYEVCWQEEVAFGSDVQNGTWPTNRQNWVYFPALQKLKDFSNIAFMPFKKVSKLVEDCPELSEKISSKEKGYFIGLIATEEDKQHVYINIANAYADCKK